MSPIDIVIIIGVAALIFVPKRILEKGRKPEPRDQEPDSRESNQDPDDLLGNPKDHDKPRSDP
jgi:hypothetical protein